MMIMSRPLLFIGLCLGILHVSGCKKAEQQSVQTDSPSKLETVRVGTILPLTGPAAQLGQDEKAGINLAAKAFAPTHRRVEFVFEDSQLKVPTALTILKKMTDVDGIRVFIATTTGIVLGITPALATTSGDKLLFTAHTVPQGTKGFPFMYRVYPAADQEIRVVADYAARKGFRRVGAYCLGNQAGEQAIELFRKAMTKAGVEVVMSDTFTPSQTDFRQTLMKFKDAKLDALLVTGYTSHYKPIFRQMIEADMNMVVLGGVATPLGNMEADLPISFLRHVVFPGCRFYYAADNPAAVSFARLAKEASVSVNYEVAYAYDCATTLMRAADAAKTSTPSDIAQAVSKITPFDGATGRIAFDQDRDILVDLKACCWTEKGIGEAL